MKQLRVATLLLSLLASACVGDDSTTTDAGGGPDGSGSDSGGPSDAAGDVATGPAHAPAGVALAADSNKACSVITGDVTISRALDESDVTDYVLYWGSSPTAKLGAPITVVAKKGSDIVYSMTNAARPQTASYLLAFTKNASGEMATGVSSAISEVGQTVFKDISAGQAAYSAQQLSTVLDAAGSKLLVAALGTGSKPVLVRCNLDGTNCTYTDISAGQGTGSGTNPVARVDTKNSKLLVVTTNTANSSKPSLFRCNLDGQSCAHVDISAGQAANCGLVPTAAIDSVNDKLVVATRNGVPSNRLGLFICNLDGTSCAFHDASAGQPDNSGLDPVMAIDTINSKLLIVARNVANSEKPSLYRCDLGGTNCTHTDISSGRGATSGQAPALVIDTVNKKLLAVTNDGSNGSRPALFRCDLDGTNCVYADLSAGQLGTGFYTFHPEAVIDAINKKLLVTTTKTYSPNIRGALYRCELDGTSCSYFDISPGGDQEYPTAVWNPLNQQLLTVFFDTLNNNKVSLFDVCGY